MTTYFIIHGTGGSPEENWFPWLRSELEEKGHTVYVPQFPIGDEQNLDAWLKVMEGYDVPDDAVFIGHSLGPAFILNWLETHKCAKAILVAGFVQLLDLHFDKYNKTFVDRDFDWESIKKHCGEIIVLNSDTDPYVPLEYGIHMATLLGTSCYVLNEAGHVNEDAGFRVFEEILEFV